MSADTSVIIVAAGNSTRMGGVNKILLPLGKSTVIGMTMKAFENCPCVADIVVVTNSVDEVRKIAEEENITKLGAVCRGGATRQESVKCGLAVISKETKLIAVHDGARPLIRPEDAERVMKDARVFGAAALAVPVKDTIKIVEGGFVTDTPYRPSLYACQTPQVFKRELYFEAVLFAEDHGITDLTDDCQLVESLGQKIYITTGSYSNIKITTPEDIKIAEVLLCSE